MGVVVGLWFVLGRLGGGDWWDSGVSRGLFEVEAEPASSRVVSGMRAAAVAVTVAVVTENDRGAFTQGQVPLDRANVR